MKGFTWERGPFSLCPFCETETFGILHAGGHTLTMRCSDCRYSENIALPPVDKKVIYLDQFVFSLLFNVVSGGRLPIGHEAFAKELHKRLSRLVILQQIILPHSDIHRDETTVFHSPIELREAYEFIGGGVSLSGTSAVEIQQAQEAAYAYINGTPLSLNLSVDGILKNERNEWLSDMHISVRSDYSQFANQIRKIRDETHDEMEKLAARWIAEKPTFDDSLKVELDAILAGKVNALAETERKKSSTNADILINAANSPIQREFRSLLNIIRKAGVPPQEVYQKVYEVWASEVFKQLPYHRISAYLFAATARRVVRGQKTIINKGMMNDIRAIAAYAPYLDAMFVDKTSAQLLQERPLSEDLEYKARIFSLADPDHFIAYLDELEANTPPSVRDMAVRIYGVT